MKFNIFKKKKPLLCDVNIEEKDILLKEDTDNFNLINNLFSILVTIPSSTIENKIFSYELIIPTGDIKESIIIINIYMNEYNSLDTKTKIGEILLTIKNYKASFWLVNSTLTSIKDTWGNTIFNALKKDIIEIIEKNNEEKRIQAIENIRKIKETEQFIMQQA